MKEERGTRSERGRGKRRLNRDTKGAGERTFWGVLSLSNHQNQMTKRDLEGKGRSREGKKSDAESSSLSRPEKNNCVLKGGKNNRGGKLLATFQCMGGGSKKEKRIKEGRHLLPRLDLKDETEVLRVLDVLRKVCMSHSLWETGF